MYKNFKLGLLGLCFTVAVAPQWALADAPSTYPVPGRLDGTTAFFHEKDAPKKANKSYPAWYRGQGENGVADANAKYFYTELIGPSAFVDKGLKNENFYLGTLELKGGETYPAHNHPAAEIYYVIEGEAEWYVDDERQEVVPGTLIYHRPYAVHGWVNKNPEKPLRVMYAWWAQGDTSLLGKGARFTNPDLFKNEKDVQPVAVPLPRVRLTPNDQPNQKYGEYTVPGRLAGTSAFVFEGATPKKATKSHPEWFRGAGANGAADENAKYFYHELLGPSLPAPAMQASHLYFGSLEQKPGYVYPSHNHPASEVYFILDGEAEWYVDDEVQTVSPGMLVYHRPFAAHGWKVTGDKPLRAIWAWWAQDDEGVLNVSAKMVNADLAAKEETAKPQAIPLPAVRQP